MSKLIILHGLPGSGKSSLADLLSFRDNAVIHSTDEYWIRPDGYYDFNFSRLREAHHWNYKRFLKSIAAGKNVIIDNTNIKAKDWMNYKIAAEMNGYEVTHDQPNTPWAKDPEKCSVMTVHRVPVEVIQKMLDNWEPWW